jgi:hypothetical protein
MNSVSTAIAVAGLLLALVFLSGIWTSRSGKPYRTVPFTAHKLLGLGAGVCLAVIVYQAHQVAPIGIAEIAAIVVTILFFIGTVAVGGLLSIDRPMPESVRKLHQILPVMALLSTIGTLILLLRGR